MAIAPADASRAKPTGPVPSKDCPKSGKGKSAEPDFASNASACSQAALARGSAVALPTAATRMEAGGEEVGVPERETLSKSLRALALPAGAELDSLEDGPMMDSLHRASSDVRDRPPAPPSTKANRSADSSELPKCGRAWLGLSV